VKIVAIYKLVFFLFNQCVTLNISLLALGQFPLQC